MNKLKVIFAISWKIKAINIPIIYSHVRRIYVSVLFLMALYFYVQILCKFLWSQASETREKFRWPNSLRVNVRFYLWTAFTKNAMQIPEARLCCIPGKSLKLRAALQTLWILSITLDFGYIENKIRYTSNKKKKKKLRGNKWENNFVYKRRLILCLILTMTEFYIKKKIIR